MAKTPQAMRPHIVILGHINVGKSTLINALCDQNIALVSEQGGTTTDPVYKSMELLPFGPVVLIDTAGLGDTSTLGEQREALTLRAIRKADMAVLVTMDERLTDSEQEMLSFLEKKEIPFIIVENVRGPLAEVPEEKNYIRVNALTGDGINKLKDKIASNLTETTQEPPIVADLLKGDAPVVLVTPIDKSAPKGRLILPQVITLRDIIDAGIAGIVCRDTELERTLNQLSQKPQLVVTDSQAFAEVAKIVPSDIPLTSFSILMARFKGDIVQLWEGAQAVDNLKPGDKVLILEACTHHRQEEDIGTVKIPRMLQKHVGGDLDFTWGAGPYTDENFEEYDLIVHCGGCMINRQEMLSRLKEAGYSNKPVVNYGILLAYLTGILSRAIKPLGL